MCKVLSQLQRRGVRLEHLRALEVFGGAGDLHTMDYADRVATIEVWELDTKLEHRLRKNLPRATVKICDALALVPFNSKRMGWRRFLPRISPAL
jgi:hypothetical protein